MPGAHEIRVEGWRQAVSGSLVASALDMLTSLYAAECGRNPHCDPAIICHV